jgi:hypothetical protein
MVPGRGSPLTGSQERNTIEKWGQKVLVVKGVIEGSFPLGEEGEGSPTGADGKRCIGRDWHELASAGVVTGADIARREAGAIERQRAIDWRDGCLCGQHDS